MVQRFQTNISTHKASMETRAGYKRRFSFSCTNTCDVLSVNPALQKTSVSRRDRVTESLNSSSEQSELELFKAESKKKTDRIEEIHATAMKLMTTKLTAATNMVVELKRNGVGCNTKNFKLLEKAFDIQKIALDKMEVNRALASTRYDNTVKSQCDSIDHWKDNCMKISDAITDVRNELSSVYAQVDKVTDTTDEVRDELNTLHYILETGEHPVRGSPFCPVSQTPLMRNDIVAVFEGDCNCNVMVKQAVAGPCVKNFNDGTDTRRCMNCFGLCERVRYFITANAIANVSWRKIETLTGCADFESVSDRSARLTKKKFDEQKAYNLRDYVSSANAMV